MKIKNYYEAPDIKVLELYPQQLICGSGDGDGSITYMETDNGSGDGDFE